MSITRPSRCIVVFGLVACVSLGCGRDPSGGDPVVAHRQSELLELYDIYFQYSKANQGPPKQLADIDQPQYRDLAAGGGRVLQSSDYVIVWGTAPGTVGVVLAYEKDAPEKGGAVLMADGTVKKMSADELKGAIKPKG